jgi:Domain of unknown function (DUF6398)
MSIVEHRTLSIVDENSTQSVLTPDFAVIRRAVRLESDCGQVARNLVNQVGGLDALEALNDAPIEDEPFDWKVVPQDGRAFIAEVVEHIDRACDQHLDVEYRTASRRLLARVMSGDSRMVLRSTRSNRIAAGVVHAIMRGNGQLEGQGRRWKAGEVSGWFGTSSVSDVAHTMIRAANFKPAFTPSRYDYPYPRTIELPSSELLISRVRASLVQQRDSLIVSAQDEAHRRDARRPLVKLSNGRGDVRTCPVDVAIVGKGAGPGGQIAVLLGLAPLQPNPDLELFALSMSEAYRLLHLLQHALDGPAARPDLGMLHSFSSSTFGFEFNEEPTFERFTNSEWYQ